uniref:AlNc14C195G8544 protein n=1 Tax=Albugo laibachii Nc14 TaxID=890382 RepID=F0WQ63_9STRA|nr:AlNc14C195G8544 [Albugo laibachii Nc14]|eukprot:CCA23469.1 AlNc14C195G8544 [Albugo laibachii Nc14]
MEQLQKRLKVKEPRLRSAKLENLFQQYTLFTKTAESDEKAPLPQSSATFPLDASNGDLLCLVESRLVGEFLFVLNKRDYIAHVLRTWKSKEEIFASCKVCSTFRMANVQWAYGKICEIVHSRGVKSGASRSLMGGFMSKSSKVEQKHAQVTQTKNEDSTVVHWFKVDAVATHSALFLVVISTDTDGNEFITKKLSDGNCVEECPIRRIVPNEECYKNYHSQSDTNGDRITASMPDLFKASRLPNEPTVYVLAQFGNWETCTLCLTSNFGTYPTTMSKTASRFQIGHSQKDRLGGCITSAMKEACYSFVVIPEELFPHEPQQASLSTEGESILKKSNYELNPAGIKKNSEITGEIPVKNETIFSHDLPSTETRPIDSGQPVNIVRIKYRKAKCLACYALVHEVLMVSTEVRYVWMVEPKRVASVCRCNWKPGSEVYHSVSHALPQISLSKVFYHQYGYKTMMSFSYWIEQTSKSVPVPIPWSRKADERSLDKP